MSKRFIEPWFPLSCLYFRNGKVEDSGPAAAMCHMYLIAETRREGTEANGALPMDVWNAKKIYRWCGIFRDKFTLEEIEQGMELAIEETLVDKWEEDGSEWIRPHDNEDYADAVERDLAAKKRREQRAKKKTLSENVATNSDTGKSEATCYPKEIKKIKDIKDININKQDISNDNSNLSDRSHDIYKEIRRGWPDYDDHLAKESAVKLSNYYPNKDILSIVKKAHAAWPPGRSIHERNGVHGFISSFVSNEKNDDDNGPRVAKTAAEQQYDRNMAEIEAFGEKHGTNG